MKLKGIMTVAKYWVKDHKCEIGTAVGIGLELVAVGLTAKATVKSKTLADNTKKRLDALWAEVEALEPGPEREQKQKEMEKTEKKEIRKCVRKVTKNYFWAAVALFGSVTSFVLSAKGYRKANKIALAALAGEVAKNKAQKERAKQILSEEQFNNVYYGIQDTGKVRENDKGEEVAIYEYCQPGEDSYNQSMGQNKLAVSPNSFYFYKEEVMSNGRSKGWWSPSPDYNKMHIDKCFKWANDKVLEEGVCTFNELREMFDLKSDDKYTPYGWVFRPEMRECQVDWKIFELDDPFSDDGYALLVDCNYMDITGKISKAVKDLADYRNADDYTSNLC